MFDSVPVVNVLVNLINVELISFTVNSSDLHTIVPMLPSANTGYIAKNVLAQTLLLDIYTDIVYSVFGFKTTSSLRDVLQ